MGGWWRWALVSPDGVAPSRMVGVSASVNLPLHHKVQKFSSGTGSPGWYWKKDRKTVVVGVSLNDTDFGFMKGKGTSDAIFTVRQMQENFRDTDSSQLGNTEVVNGHSFILIRQMVALVRRILAEVCTVPVLIVVNIIIARSAFWDS